MAQLAAAARSLQSEDGAERTLDRCVTIATELFEGCRYAAVSVVHRNAPIDTAAASDPRVRRGDELQYELQEGPCLDAIWHDETVHSPDLRADERWPTWGPRVAEELDIRGMLSFQLFTDQNSLGALNLYSTTVGSFDDEDVEAGLLLAAETAVALAQARAMTQLHTAALHRTVIGQAQGILMERYQLDAQAAFAVLRRISQANNVKLHRVATELVDSRLLPTVAPEERR